MFVLKASIFKIILEKAVTQRFIWL